MRIVALHNLKRGGALRRLSAQLAALSEAGDEVIEVCLATATPATASARVIRWAPAAPRSRRALRPALRYADLAGLARAWRRAAALAEGLRPDAVYLNPCQFVQAPLAALWLRNDALYFCDEPRRVDHDPTVAGSRNPATRQVYAPLYAAQRRLDARAVGACRSVLTNSAYTRGEIGRAYGRTAEVIPLGVSPRFTAAGSPKPGRHLLSVGTLLPSKGHDLAILAAAATAVRRPLIVVAPREEPREAQRLHNLARRMGVELTLRIGIPDAQLAQLYRSAHATLYLARREPLGLASLEAQACGSPVVVSDEGGLPETLIDTRTGWVTRRDARAVAACLELLEAPGARATVGAAAAAHASAFTWPRSAAALRAGLEEACQSPS
ncbi:MAG: hypothetical protein V7607_749 [Solirubrobacteraceae bacterium]